MEPDYVRACEIAFARSDPPRKFSKQGFNLFPKIQEIDRLMTPQLQHRVVECHPELAFWAMNRERALDEPKKVKSRPHPPGIALRRDLLAGAGMPPALLCEDVALPRGAAIDDLLDAAACAWTARRAHAGTAHRLPPEPHIDERGLRMQIWA